MKKILLILLLTMVSAVSAETIKIVVPFAAGGPADRTARVLEKILTAKTQYNYVVEFRVGAGGSIAANHVSMSRGSETVLLVHSLALVINSLSADASYSLSGFEPVATLGSIQLALITGTNSRVNTMPKLLATRDPVFFGSSGIGSATHVAGELFGRETGVDMTHVPYKGEPAAVADMLGNNIDALFAAVSVAQSHSFNVLAVTGTKRSKEFPKVPTFQEQGIKGFEINPNWYVLMANPTADQRTIAVIKAALSTALREDPTVFSQVGVDTNRSELYNTQQFLLSEQQRMRRLLDRIKLDNK